MRWLTQRNRLLVLIIYIVLLMLVSLAAFGSLIPPTNEKGLWFYSGLAALLLGNLLVTPFFTKPVDAISNAVAAMVSLLAVNVWLAPNPTSFDQFLWTVCMIYVTLVLVAGILAIAFRDAQSLTLRRLAESCFVFCNAFGSSRLVFSAVFLFALITFHSDSPREYLIIAPAWAILIGLHPVETIFDLIGRLRAIWATRASAETIGEVVGHQIPGIVLIRQQEGSELAFGDSLIVRGDDGKPGLAVALDPVGFAEGVWIRALHMSMPVESHAQIAACIPSKSCGTLALRVDMNQVSIPPIADQTWEKRQNLLGLVAPETDIDQMQIELVRSDIDVEEGRLVEVAIGHKPIVYQILNGLTKEEIVQQKNTRGYVRAVAKKIGHWNADGGFFEIVRWVPQPNSAVFLIDNCTPDHDREAVGYFPGTRYPVKMDVHNLVTHNTAILGILGVGKSFLALELVERMLESGIKVICLDLTNQYAEQLQLYYDRDQHQPEIQELLEVGPPGRTLYNRNKEEGGSHRDFRHLLTAKLTEFLRANDAEGWLRIFNPAQFEVWQQTGGMYNSVASMATLTPVEITRIFAETILQILQEQGMSDQARCCLIFEEAHALIPEWNSVASEGDKTATSGTARAILQGRKFGLGCFVITQRTANVTKSILNQCNTVFALRVFDATGMGFLKNYIGDDYAGVLSTLPDRHAVIFGRASSCRDPVLVRLNDRENFLTAFRPQTSATNDIEVGAQDDF